MDSSREYVDMCVKCGIEPIGYHYRMGTLFYNTGTKDVTTIAWAGSWLDKPVQWVPLWQQDQLQEMIVPPYKNFLNEYFFFEDFVIANMIDDNGDIPEPYKFSSMEQLWLAFVMKEKFGKVWDKGEWVKEERR